MPSTSPSALAFVNAAFWVSSILRCIGNTVSCDLLETVKVSDLSRASGRSGISQKAKNNIYNTKRVIFFEEGVSSSAFNKVIIKEYYVRNCWWECSCGTSRLTWSATGLAEASPIIDAMRIDTSFIVCRYCIYENQRMCATSASSVIWCSWFIHT